MIFRVFLSTSLIFGYAFGDLYSRGEKIADLMCKKEILDLNKSLISKESITQSRLCKKMSDKNLEALIIFLSGKKDKSQQNEKLTISVPKDAKCPVCGMFVAKYPKWSATIIKEDGDRLYFDGVKDMMKFYLDPKRFHSSDLKVKDIFVTDYYTLRSISAKDAYFVKGSNIYGPMGEELIPFKTLNDAKEFKSDHEGKSILRFDEIKTKDLY